MRLSNIKKIVLLLIVAIISTNCSKDKGIDTSEVNESSKLNLEVFRTKKLSTSEEVKEKTIFIGDFMIWESEGKDFEIKSIKDLEDGFAYDKVSKKSYKYTKKASNVTDKVPYVNPYIEYIKPGKYFVFIRLNNMELGLSNAWSYTTIDVKKGENKISKTFSSSAQSYSYDPW